MLHQIPHFRQLILASFSCPHCGYCNNEVTQAASYHCINCTYQFDFMQVTFGGEIQLYGSELTLNVICEKDLYRQIVKSDRFYSFFLSS